MQKQTTAIAIEQEKQNHSKEEILYIKHTEEIWTNKKLTFLLIDGSYVEYIYSYFTWNKVKQQEGNWERM